MSTFTTDTGRPVPSVTAAQMREIDRIAMEETGPNLFQMMENAGANLAALAMELLEEPAPVLALAGPGGNGGGGICAARHLANHGIGVWLCLSEPDRLGPVPALQRKILQQTSAKEFRPEQLGDLQPGLILDALIGYSLSGAPRGCATELIRWANGSGAPILALDVPSGVDATTGNTSGEYIHAHTTMTLALPKTGLSGQLVLADIGIPEGVYRKLGLGYSTPFDRRSRVPLRRLP